MTPIRGVTRTLLCDASFDQCFQVAAIAVCEGTGQQRGTLLAGDVIPVNSTTEAELHAILRACSLLAGGRETGALIFTDCQQAAVKAARPGSNVVALDVQAALLARDSTLRLVNRGAVKPSDRAARAMRLAWVAGNRHEPTYRPRPYLSRKRGVAAA